MDHQEIERGMLVSRQPSEPELQNMASDGVRGVVDLRTSDEEIPVPAQTERRVLARSGVEYLRIPLPRGNLDAASLDRVRKNVDHLPHPVLIHSPQGRRAGMFALAHRALREGWGGARAVREADRLGIEFGDERDARAIMAYVDRRHGTTSEDRTTALRPEQDA